MEIARMSHGTAVTVVWATGRARERTAFVFAPRDPTTGFF